MLMMMKLSLVLSSSLLFAGSAAAFSTTTTARTMTTTAGPLTMAKADYAGSIGVVAPLGVWDPLGVLERNGFDEVEFDRLRGLELKHGRVAMLAVVGYLVTYAGVRLPGLEEVPSGLAAFTHLPETVAGQMGATLIFMEIANRDQTGGKAAFVGDFRNNFLDFGWTKQSPAWQTSKRNIELNNGRAAQMGIVGIVSHELMGNLGEILPTP
jgi:Chlorophyll A-B binding protein